MLVRIASMEVLSFVRQLVLKSSSPSAVQDSYGAFLQILEHLLYIEDLTWVLMFIEFIKQVEEKR